MVVKEFLEDREMYNPDIESVVQEYARIKCQELLEIVAEKATIYDSKYDGFYIDKRSILSAVDLDSFIS